MTQRGDMNKEITVKQKDDAPIAVEVLAESIKAISDGVRKLRSGRLNDKALLLLIQHACPAERKYGPKPGVGTIKAVLAGMDALERTYLKPKNK
jgi:hypothetical protein